MGKKSRKMISQSTVLTLSALTTIGVISGNIHAQEEESKGYNLLLEEIVVTAQKRAEDYMDVPITVNAFTEQDMINTGAATIQDIDDFMPGVEIDDTAGGTTQVGITIRGVSSPNISSGQDPSIATFYDGSYMPRAVTSIPFTDIARTEVLKGPQGTLFGRNATAGVINIVPNQPHEDFEGYVKTKVGNYGLVRLEGMINTPISDSLALRANVFSHERDGFTDQKGIGGGVRDENFVAAKVSLLWTISDDTDLQLTYDMEDRDEMPRAAIGVSTHAYSTDPFSGKTAHDVAGQEETRDMYGISVKLNHDINDNTFLTGVLSYRDWETTNLQEEDGTDQARRYLDTNNIEDSDILYGELRLNYVEDKLNLIVGANYSEEDVYQRTDIHIFADSYMEAISPAFGSPVHLWDVFGDDQDTYLFLTSVSAENPADWIAVLPSSFAGQLLTEDMTNTGSFENWGIFADATYQITDEIRIAAGLRYSNDDKDYSWQTSKSDLEWIAPQARFTYFPERSGADPANYFDKFTSSDSWSKVTGRLVGDWQFSDEAMLYASYATGYKSGGFDGQTFTAVQVGPFDAEEIESVELGLKGDFFDNSLRIEAALFRHELEGRQISVSAKGTKEDFAASNRVINANEDTNGIELIAYWNVLDNLRLTGMTTYRETDSEQDRYINADSEDAGGPQDSSESDAEYTLRFDWTPEIATGFLLVHMDYIFREDSGPTKDTAIFFTGSDRWYFQDEKVLNARVSWQNNDENIEVALWGRNILDEERAGNPGGAVAEILGAYHTNISDPRTYGLDLRYSF